MFNHGLSVGTKQAVNSNSQLTARENTVRDSNFFVEVRSPNREVLKKGHGQSRWRSGRDPLLPKFGNDQNTINEGQKAASVSSSKFSVSFCCSIAFCHILCSRLAVIKHDVESIAATVSNAWRVSLISFKRWIAKGINGDSNNLSQSEIVLQRVSLNSFVAPGTVNALQALRIVLNPVELIQDMIILLKQVCFKQMRIIKSVSL